MATLSSWTFKNTLDLWLEVNSVDYNPHVNIGKTAVTLTSLRDSLIREYDRHSYIGQDIQTWTVASIHLAILVANRWFNETAEFRIILVWVYLLHISAESFGLWYE
jgi:hypothetical protein